MIRKLAVDYVNFIKECWVHASVRFCRPTTIQLLYDYKRPYSNPFPARIANYNLQVTIIAVSTHVSHSLWYYVYQKVAWRTLLLATS